MYCLVEIKDVNDHFHGVEILANGRTVASLNRGISLTIATMYANLEAPQQDAFLNGIVLALNHCTITGLVPAAMV